MIKRSLRQGAAERIGNAGGRDLNSAAICCPVRKAGFTAQFLEDLLRYDMRDTLHVFWSKHILLSEKRLTSGHIP
jgi:hypothetical protein